MLVGAFPSGAVSAPFAYAGLYRSADASWLVKEKGDYYMYLAVAGHGTSAEGSQTRALVARAKCLSLSDKHFTIIACSIGGRMKMIAAERFEFDPLLGSARLRWKGNRVDWVGAGEPFPGVYPDAGQYGVFGWVDVMRMAKISGTVLGEHLKNNRDAFGMLDEGGIAYVATSPNGEIRHYADGRVRAEMEFRIPK
jgi:hypothetical protein